MSLDLAWLPEHPAWKELLAEARTQTPEAAFAAFQRLANSRMDFVRAGQLDKAVQRYLGQTETAPMPTIHVALLGSSTLSHLIPGIHVAALRRGFLIDLYLGPYGMYRQELADPDSGLHRFRPEFVCLAFDAQHLIASEETRVEEVMVGLESTWQAINTTLGATVIQQTLLPRFPSLMGNNENRLQTSQATILQAVNAAIRERAQERGVSLLSVDTWAAVDGLSAWFDRSLWYSAKQEIHPRASTLYGEQVARVVAALRGRSAKCLVLDLDNTLWGGVIGDDGLEGIVLGQGSTVGEAFVGFQRYVRQLSRRGVILAVCSKNDEEYALAAFDRHPEMVLRRSDIACFVANWQDKAANLRQIAATLNIGLDALVFVDDNPAERRLIRSELPMVSVPELPEDPAEYISCLVDAGYFEAVDVTAEDRERTQLYQANARRQAKMETATDLGSYLEGLEMQLAWGSFHAADVKRIVQLIHKTNQFNLTTRRYSDAEVAAVMQDEDALTLQLRLTDIHGDNGLIGLVVGYRTHTSILVIDTWLMSCRVLGRGMEEATLNILAARAAAMQCTTLVGVYRPTAKNGMVRELYERLGFEKIETLEDGSTRWSLLLDRFTPRVTHIRLREGDTCRMPLSIAS